MKEKIASKYILQRFNEQSELNQLFIQEKFWKKL